MCLFVRFYDGKMCGVLMFLVGICEIKGDGLRLRIDFFLVLIFYFFLLCGGKVIIFKIMEM